MPNDWHPRDDKFRSSAQRRMWFARDPEAAERVAHKQKRKNDDSPVHLPGHVGKRDHGTRTSYSKLPRKVHGRGRPSSRYGGTPGHGRRTEEPSNFSKAAFTPTPVLARTKPIAQLAADGGSDLSPAAHAAATVMAPKGSAGAAGKTNALAGKLVGLQAQKPISGMGGTANGSGLASMGAQRTQKPVSAMGTVGSMSKSYPSLRELLQDAKEGHMTAAEARQMHGQDVFDVHSNRKARAYRERFKGNGEPRPGLKTSPIRRRRHLTAEDQDYLGPESDYQHTSGNRVRKALTGGSKKAVGRLALIAAGTHGARQAGDFAAKHKVLLEATGGGYVGGRVGSRRHVEKAFPAGSNVPVLVRTQRRSHDPERGRQFRLGAATAGTAAGGGLSLVRGGRELGRLNRAHASTVREFRNAAGGLEHAKLLNLKGGGGVGVGIAGLAGAAQLARYASSNKNRRWT